MDDDGFDFSDDDLDDLPSNAWQQFETTALHATQHPQLPENDYEVDYGDGEVINLDDTTGSAQFAQLQVPPQYGTFNGQHAIYQNNDREHGDEGEHPAAIPSEAQTDVSKLLLRIKQQEIRLRAAEATATKKAGEADNLRRRMDTERKAADQARAAQQRADQEARDRIAAERDHLRRQLEQAKTNNAFDEHNARQGEQMRRPRLAMATRPKNMVLSPNTTPKKAQKQFHVGDGFDNDDVVAGSPSKRKDKVGAATPRQASKRKRQIMNDSPVPALSLSEPRERARTPVPFVHSDGDVELMSFQQVCNNDDRFALLQRLIAFRCSDGDEEGEERILEVFAKFAFPSQSSKKISSIIYDSLSDIQASPNPRELALQLCGIFFELWKQCLREKYLAPIFLILDALDLILACEPAETAINTMDQIVPLIMQSVRLVAVPIHSAANANGNAANVNVLFSPYQRSVVSQIHAEDCLDLLHIVATSCLASPRPEALQLFWRTMPLEFVLLLLQKEQTLSHMTRMLRLLDTSSLSASLGPIASPEGREQAALESDLITRLTNLFQEAIAPVPDPKKRFFDIVTEAQVWQLRLQVLGLISEFSTTDYGCAALAQHNLCIGRLVKYLNHSMTSLYRRPMAHTQSLKIDSVNVAMKLIHHIAARTGVDIKSKLNATLGGHHAYHLVLTRLAFLEGVLLEDGIEAQVCDMAHEILDESLGVEEGEALEQVFPSPSGNTL